LHLPEASYLLLVKFKLVQDSVKIHSKFFHFIYII
jgi:hypothetical protein